MAKALPIMLQNRVGQQIANNGLTLAAAADLDSVGTATVKR